jgi:AAA15 family ATPase/GTPase
MINELHVRNFKSIKDSGRLELKPLTILAGPNSSGKSNLLESIALISQVAHLEGALSRSFQSLLLNGKFIAYPDISFVTYCKNEKLPIAIKLFFPISDEEKSKVPTSANKIGYELEHIPESQELEQIIYFDARIFVQTAYLRTETGFRSAFLKPNFLRRFAPNSTTSEILSQQIFSPITVPSADMRFRIGDFLRKARICVDVILRRLRRVFFISAARGIVPNVGKAQEQPVWVGKMGENLLSLLSLIFSKREYSPKAEKIRCWAKKFGVNALSGGWWGGDQIGVDFEDPILKSAFELSLASFGTRQVLTMITQIFWSKEGDTIMIEEPEISLHPKSQITVLELFAEAVNEGKQIICTTHSPFLIIALSKVVKSGKLSSKDIAVFHADKTSDGTKFLELPIDEKGFIKGWIPSFAEVEEKMLDELSSIFRE